MSTCLDPRTLSTRTRHSEDVHCIGGSYLSGQHCFSGILCSPSSAGCDLVIPPEPETPETDADKTASGLHAVPSVCEIRRWHVNSS